MGKGSGHPKQMREIEIDVDIVKLQIQKYNCKGVKTCSAPNCFFLLLQTNSKKTDVFDIKAVH